MTNANNEVQTMTETAPSGVGRLEAIMADLQEQKARKFDFTADSRLFEVIPAQHENTEQGIKYTGRLILKPLTGRGREFMGGEGLTLSLTAALQLAEKAQPSIPTKFTKAMKEAQPDLLARLVTDLMHRSPKVLFWRTFTDYQNKPGYVRAALSNSYKGIDNLDVALAALDAAQRHGARVLNASITESKLRIRMIHPQVWEALNNGRGWHPEDRNGGKANQSYLRTLGDGGFDYRDLPGGFDAVYPVAEAGNSEIGNGAYYGNAGTISGACANLMLFTQSMRTVHLGKKLSEGIWSKETHGLEAAAIVSKTRDLFGAAFSKDGFAKLMQTRREVAGEQIVEPRAAVDNIVKQTGISEKRADAIFGHFLRDYQQTRGGLAEAIARAAQDTDNADEQAEFERVAGQVGFGALKVAA